MRGKRSWSTVNAHHRVWIVNTVPDPGPCPGIHRLKARELLIMAVQPVPVRTDATRLEMNAAVVNARKLPKSAQMIVRVLSSSSKPLDISAIQLNINYSLRTTRASLRLLIKLRMVDKQVSLIDARKAYYRLRKLERG
ncbi:MAG: hypothetical protein ACFFD4_20685 [Candidatus Odinarchaeota archaeon]